MLSYQYRKISGLHRYIKVISAYRISTSVGAESGEKTRVLLKKLPWTVTQSSLGASIQNENIRKVDLQPGFVLHVSNPAVAELVATTIREQLQCEAWIGHATLPSLLLRNIPNDVTPDILKAAFNDLNPVSVHISGGSSIQFSFDNAAVAMKFSEAVESIKIMDQSLKTNISEIDKQNYVVSVWNLHPSSTSKDFQTALKSVLPQDLISNLKIYHSKDQGKVLQIRLKSTGNTSKIKTAIADIKLKGKSLIVSDPFPLPHPCVFIRNISHLTEEQLRPLVEKFNPRRVNFSYRSDSVLNNTMVLYFETEHDAYHAFKSLKNTSLDNQKLSVTFKEVAEPEVFIKNVPSTISDNDVKESLKNIAMISYTTEALEDPGRRNIRILLANPRAVEQCMSALNGYELQIETDGMSYYTGLTVEVPPGLDADDASLLAALVSCVPDSTVSSIAKSITMNTNRQAFINFLTYDSALRAQKAFTSDQIKIMTPTLPDRLSATIDSRISAYPSYTVEVDGLDVEISLANALEKLKDHYFTKLHMDMNRCMLSADRVAIVKFKRNMHVVPGMKKLRTIDIDGKKISVERYYPQNSTSYSEYDAENASDDFDRLTLRSILADNLREDPATRYQVAKNMFERTISSLESSEIKDKASYLMTEGCAPHLLKEAAKILESRNLTENDRKRLFELFLQRDDMYTFLADFQDFIAAFGQPSDSDVLDWSQFDILDDKDLMKIQSALKARELELEGNPQAMQTPISDNSVDEYVEKVSSEISQFSDLNESSSPKPRYSLDDDDNDVEIFKNRRKRREDDIIVEGQDGDEKISLLDPSSLVDRDGRPWSGIILHTDTTQKVLPGQRLMSYRALVMIGNLRGAGGFGVGKGQSADKAIESAFRDALRNLIFIDLYENSGLAHDLYGKHNACHVYIRATPKSRLFAGGDAAYEILTRMGISSASVKIAGRRNPYSVTRAIFNALSQHVNLDEYAKQRGKRYLTLQWAYKNNL